MSILESALAKQEEILVAAQEEKGQCTAGADGERPRRPRPEAPTQKRRLRSISTGIRLALRFSQSAEKRAAATLECGHARPQMSKIREGGDEPSPQSVD